MIHDIHYGLFFIFIFLAFVYFAFNRKDNSNLLLIWIIPLMLYLNFGTLSIKNYIPIPITVKFLSIIMFPSILLLAQFLSLEEKIIKKFLMPSVLALLFFSSLGFIYLSDERAIISEIKQAYSFVKNDNGQGYTDERTKMVFDYLSGFELKENFKQFNSFNLYSKNEKNTLADLKNLHNSLVIVNSGMIKGLPILYKGIKFPEQIANIPKQW